MNKLLRRTEKKIQQEYLRIIAVGGILAFALFPLFTLAFHIKSEDIAYVLGDANFRAAIINSFIYTLAATLITIFLAVITAYFLNTSSIKCKNVLVILLTLGMLVPTISIGLGIRITFGNEGFLSQITGCVIEGRGFLGLILGAVITAFPATFLIIYDALRYENKGPYDAASILGISRFSTFFRLTLPYLKISIVSAFFACFTLIFSDYGIPMEVAGKVKTLPMYLYEQFVSTFQYGRGSIVGFVLLIPAWVSFIFDLVFRDESAGEKQRQMIYPGKGFNIVTGIIIGIVCAFLFLPQLAFISLSFMKSFPNDMTFTLEHVADIFANTRGVGLGNYIRNSLIIAGLSALIGMCYAYGLGYLSVRKSGRMGKVIDLLALSTIAIPGIVLGVGYIFLYGGTNGIFYGTIAILVIVNVFHFLGSPYLIAKNCLTKINKDYEIIGETLGISKWAILTKVLIPNSCFSLIEMFSYFFLNSMITISAVAFLCTYDNQPLSILIISYEKNSNYEMQSVISLLILTMNVIFRIFTSVISTVMKKIQGREKEKGMELSRYQFEMLTFLEKNGKQKYSKRVLADGLTYSLSTITKLLRELQELNYITINADYEIHISESGLKALEPYRVRKAIILAAGFGQRLAPVTLETPKPMVKVEGVRIIDTLLDALVAKGITNILIVRGYKKEKFNELLEKYPFIQFIDNPEYNVTNNISSLMCAAGSIDRCYICEADLYISNPDVINKYEYATNYLGARVAETDDWCFKKKKGYVTSYKMGGTDCYQAFGISYWNETDSAKLCTDIKKVYHARAGKENLWESVPLRIFKKNYKIEIRKCEKSDIIEIDNFSELVAVDESYKDFPGHEEY